MAGSYNTTINVWLGDLELVNTNDSMLSVDHSRVANAVSESLVIEAYDDTAVVIDNQIVDVENGELELQYGYVDGNLSEKYKVTITKYSTTFTGRGTLCTIEGTSTAVAEATTEGASSGAKTYKGTISDIVQQVAAEEGWDIGSVEATSFDEFEFTRNDGQSGLDFIASNCQNKAVSLKDGRGGYNFFIREDGGRKVIYFTPSLEAESFGEFEDDSIDPYSYQFRLGMPNERIISFTPEYQEVLAALLGANAVVGNAQDSESNDSMKVEVRKKTAENSQLDATVRDFFEENSAFPLPMANVGDYDISTLALDNSVMRELDENEIETSDPAERVEAAVETEDTDALDLDNVTRYVSGNAYSADELKDIATSLFEAASSLVYTATLTIKGSPNIVPNSIINILVLTREGLVHHSSGKYCVSMVEDTIEGGVYTTTLSLMKNVDKIPENYGMVSGNGTQMTVGDAGNGGGASTPLTGSVDSQSLQQKIQRYLGTPYIWGGDCWEEGGFDCSGFTWYFHVNELGHGATIGGRDTAAGMSTRGTLITPPTDRSKYQPGDLLYPSHLGHVVMWVGGGEGKEIVHSPKPGGVITYANLYFEPAVVRRY